MAVTIEYKEGIFYIVTGAVELRATFPKDAQHQSAPPLMGFNYDTGDFIPIAISSDGKLQVENSGGMPYKGSYTETARDAILTWVEPDVIYNTDAHKFQWYDDLAGWQTFS